MQQQSRRHGSPVWIRGTNSWCAELTTNSRQWLRYFTLLYVVALYVKMRYAILCIKRLLID